MLWPNGSTKMPQVSSPFGPRRAPVPGASTFHRGADFIGFYYNHAIDHGVVIVAGTPAGWGGGGLQVWVQHAGFVTRFLHNKAGSLQVRVGDRVKPGQILGVMGKTGNVSGVHLHLEIVVGGSQVDPVAFIQKHLTTAAPAATSGSNKTVEDEEMPIAILERTNSALTKSLYDVRTGKAIRAISRDENTAFRAGVSTGAVVYITVSDAEYTQRGGK